MKFRELFEDRTMDPVLTDQQFHAVLTVARMWFETQQPKRRRGGRRRGRPAAPVEPAFEEAPDFDLAEELR